MACAALQAEELNQSGGDAHYRQGGMDRACYGEIMDHNPALHSCRRSAGRRHGM
jgi:hypothetical protein